MTTKYRLTSLSAENCAEEIHSKIQELCFFLSKNTLYINFTKN